MTNKHRVLNILRSIPLYTSMTAGEIGKVMSRKRGYVFRMLEELEDDDKVERWRSGGRCDAQVRYTWSIICK